MYTQPFPVQYSLMSRVIDCKDLRLQENPKKIPPDEIPRQLQMYVEGRKVDLVKNGDKVSIGSLFARVGARGGRGVKIPFIKVAGISGSNNNGSLMSKKTNLKSSSNWCDLGLFKEDCTVHCWLGRCQESRHLPTCWGQKEENARWMHQMGGHSQPVDRRSGGGEIANSNVFFQKKISNLWHNTIICC